MESNSCVPKLNTSPTYLQNLPPRIYFCTEHEKSNVKNIEVKSLRLNEENQSFFISIEMAQYCEFFKYSFQENQNIIEIPAELNIRNYILPYILDFIEYRVMHPEQIEIMDKMCLNKNENEIDQLHEKDFEFCQSMYGKNYVPTLLRIILSAGALQIESLSLLAYKGLAQQLANLKPEDLKDFFFIPEHINEDERSP